MNKLLKKLIALLLLMCLMSVNLSTLGFYGMTYALSENEISNQNSKTQEQNVEFNAYFEGGVHNKTEKMNSTAKMYIDIKVSGKGYLEKGVISFQNTNFEIDKSINDLNIQNVDIENNKILLNKINGSSNVKIEVPINILKSNEVAVDNFSKETKTVFTATYINSNAKEKNVSKEIINKLSWDATTDNEIKAEVKAELTKYITYATEEKQGVVLQAKINSRIKDNVVPTKETELSIQVPEINNSKPTAVTVVANKTEATNGEKNGLNFNSENYAYNVETGSLAINVKNLSDKITWLKNVNDEYLVTFTYEGKEVYDFVVEHGIDANLKINGNIKVYSNQEKIIKIEEVNTEIKANEVVGELVDYSINSDSSIAKGQMYANYDAKSKKETSYNVSYNAIVSALELTNEIKFEQKIDQFVTKDGEKNPTTISKNNYTYNKTITIAKNVFEKILGEEGKVEIYDMQKTKIGTINKTSTIENGNYVLNISTLNNNQLTILTSKPVAEGKFTINIEKSVKENIDYSKQQLKAFTKLALQLNNETTEISLTEPKTIIGVEVNKQDLTTVVENENVEIRAVLDTSSMNNALYSNTTLKIKFPEYISKFKINSYDILMANGLKIKDLELVKENGQIVINVELEGKQTEYTIDAEYKGTIIIFNTNIKARELTPNNENKITMEYVNSNDVATNAKGTVETKLNFVAPQGIITANGISNYAKGEKELLSISNEGVTGTIQTYAEKRTATITGKVINNYNNNIKDIVILGRIPVQGNKEIDTEKDLGSTFSTKLVGKVELKGIDASKYTVYYSENAEATKELNENNNWNTENTANVQSYMIVLNDYEMKNGETLEITYNVEIPEGITYNNTVNEVYKVYYTNVSLLGEIAESKISPVVKLSTGVGPELSIELKSTAETVREGQIVKMKATIKNIGNLDATNAKARIPLPEYTEFIDYVTGNGFFEIEDKTKTIDIGTIKAGESKEICYYLKMNKIPALSIVESITQEELAEKTKFPKEISNIIYISTNGLEGEIPSNECIINLQEGKIEINMSSSISESYVLKNEDEMEYTINVVNISKSGNLNDVVVTIPLPGGTTYKDAIIKESWSAKDGTTEGITYDKTSNVITIKLGTLDIRKVIMLNIEIEKFEGNISIMAKAKAEGTEEHYSNISEYETEITNLKISELTSSPKYIKETENVTYSFKISNEGKSVINNIKITDNLPEGLTFEEAMYEYAGKEQKVSKLNNGKVEITITSLNVGESKEIKIIAKADLLPNKNDKQINNKVLVSAGGFSETETNSVTNIIEYNEKAHANSSNPINPDNPIDSPESTYKITGTAWIDSNKNGMRDEEEEFLSNIKVMLAYKKTSKIVKDSKTNAEKITTTNSQGQYQFDNLLPDEYFVIFDYGNGNYSLTEYRKPGVDETLNSDAIDSNMTINGVKTVVGISDAIKITNNNVRDIDIGVYVAEKFDLKLDKYITKITRTTPTSGTETFIYNNEQNTKIEVLKQNLGKSSIVIEYKIVITNQGGVAGYAKKIADYLPQGVIFNTELNKDWYLAKDGNVYNTSLENAIINPGESKEVTLVLLKQITENSIGILNNNAEIYESYNEQGIEDIDSTPANKQEDEDDMSKADVVLGIVTGAQITIYAVLALSVIAIIGFGIFEIKKRVLNKN